MPEKLHCIRYRRATDDIYTTGATLDACSMVLKNAGAAAVIVLTLQPAGM
jgi:predicted amidophosphoribosyltransferase